jgi:hypothetical protein
MRILTMFAAHFALLVCAVGAPVAMAKDTWTIQEDRGDTVSILCADASNATVAKAKGGWTVVSAGKKGAVGGWYDIVGQAALAACGE